MEYFIKQVWHHLEGFNVEVGFRPLRWRLHCTVWNGFSSFLVLGPFTLTVDWG